MKRPRPTNTGLPLGLGSLLTSSILRPAGFSKRFSRDGAVIMMSGTEELFNDEGEDDEDDEDDVTLLKDCSFTGNEEKMKNIFVN